MKNRRWISLLCFILLVTGCRGQEQPVVPAEEGISFVVNDAILDEETYMLVGGKERLRTKSGEILLLCGNVSDIFPSFVVTAVKDENEVTKFSPSLSLRDGTLNQYEGVYDFTAYDGTN